MSGESSVFFVVTFSRNATTRAPRWVKLLSRCGVLALLGVPLCAPAQTAPPDNQSGELQEIVVNARRSAERLEDVPVAVTALGANDLAQQRITSEADLQYATPGLLVREATSSNQTNYSLRGQSVDAFSETAPAVVAYFNEVATAGTSQTSFFDLESIQVLKGPQGTLFGRNATGGAVLYAAKQPDADFGGYIKGGFGNFANKEFEGAVNLPITDGVAVRVAGRSQTRDGYQHNLLDNSFDNSVDYQVGRISLLIAPPGSGFRNVTVFQDGHYGGTNGALKIQAAYGVPGFPSTYVNPTTGLVTPLTTTMADLHGPNAAGPGISSTYPEVNALFNGIGDYFSKTAHSGFYDVYINRNQDHDAHQTFASNTATYDITSNLTLKNIAGYNKVYSYDQLDVEGSPYEFFGDVGGPRPYGDGYTFDTFQYSDEQQISGTAGPFKYIGGLFYSKQHTHNVIPVTITPDLGASYLGAYNGYITDTSKAVYAQSTYAITDRLNLSGGIRYTWEDTSIVFGPGLLEGLIPSEIKNAKPSWLVGFDYKIADAVLLYFTQRGSWRAGTFNDSSPNRAPYADYYLPETTYDFELGAKFDGHLGSIPTRVNLALYDQHVHNVQRATYIGASGAASNANEARVTGAELDGSLNLTDWLQVGANYAYTDARYTDPQATVAGKPYLFGPYADAPRSSGSAYFRAATQLPSKKGELALRGQVYSQTSFYYSNQDATIMPGTQISGYTLVNARLEWNHVYRSNLSAALYVNNLTERRYDVGGLSLAAVSGTIATLAGPPRMFGIELEEKF